MKRFPVVLAISLLLAVASLGSLLLGRYPVSLDDMMNFTSWSFHGCPGGKEQEMGLLQNIFLDIRLPRIIGAVMVGSALSVSGTAFQSMFINPLVSPGLLGVLAGASFGAALGMVFFNSLLWVQILAFAFGCGAVSLSMVLARFNTGDRLLMLILGGIISGAFFTALLSIVKYLADPYNQLPAIVFWLMGGLSTLTNDLLIYLSLPILASMAALMTLTPYMNALSMGDEEARSLGVHVGLVRAVLISCATLMSALTVVMAGIIGWVGLVVPHIARMLIGPDNRILIPTSALIGALYLLLMDDLSRLVFTVEIPLGILTALCGIPFFVLVLKHARKGWG
ncbi:MAG: iron ABC transporter permease [Proteobacteria bacterium]|nr:iron ABC transporter permease [Pseudomonadota bacterium]